MLRRAPDLQWLVERPSPSILAAGVFGSLLLGLAAFSMWGFAGDGFADDAYLWWTLAGFLLPILVAVGLAAVGHSKPESAPAIGVAALMLAVAFLSSLLR